MSVETSRPVLHGKKALVVGIANEYYIAWGCARAFHDLGAEVAVTCLDEKSRPSVEPLARPIGSPILMPLDVSASGQLEALFERIGAD